MWWVIKLVLLLIGALLSIVILFDLYNNFNTWQARIRIGRWNNRSLWRNAIERKARIWLKKMPLIPKSDNDRLVLIDIIRHDYYSKAVQSWQVAGLIMGLEVRDAVAYFESIHQLSDLTSSEIDFFFLVYALKSKGIIDVGIEEKLKNRIINSKQQTLPYRKALPDIRFVDSLGFACPLLYSLGMDSMADKQIEDFDRVLYNGIFPPHAVKLNDYLPLGAYDWGRGLGWYILCLIESGRHSERIIKLASQLLNYQKFDGSFGCFVFNPYSQKESSITSLAGLLFVKAYELNLEPSFLKAAIATENALMSMTRRNGAIDYAQGDTKGIGLYSYRFGTMPFVQGMTLALSKRLDPYIN